MFAQSRGQFRVVSLARIPSGAASGSSLGRAFRRFFVWHFRNIGSVMFHVVLLSGLRGLICTGRNLLVTILFSCWTFLS